MRKVKSQDSLGQHPTQAARERLLAAFGAPVQPQAKLELWARVAYFLLAVLALALAYLGLRGGGRGPLFVWRYGRDIVFLAAWFTLIWALIQSVRSRPFLQARRLRPMLALALILGVTPFQFPYPSSHEGRPSSTRFVLPVRGSWRVLWGGEDKDSNRLASFFAEQRWALALAREEGGGRRRGVAELPQDALAFGEEVRAPAAGEIVLARDQFPDGNLIDYSPQTPLLGNLVVLKISPEEYLFLAHLRQGSLAVAEGQRVEQGELLAQVGSSGFSRLVAEPHLLLYLQDSPREAQGEPIPWNFHDYFNGERLVERGLPKGGMASDGRSLGALVRSALPD